MSKVSEELILNILAQNDPFGLIDMGAPDDEYSPEVEEIMGVLEECNSVDELNHSLIVIFEHWFYDIPNDDVGQEQKMKIKQCSIDIWEHLKN